MATFTPEEIEGVIERLVRSSIRRPYDTLGVRRTDITFNDVQEAAAGVFLLYQKTPYYFAFLGTSRLEEQVSSVAESIQELLGLVGVLRRRVLPVKDVTPLANARAALFELESAVTKNGPPRDVTKVPAYQRFNANIDRFLGAVGSNIRDATGIVPTPSEARGRIPAAVKALEDAMNAIVARVGYISEALNDYRRLNLPSLVSGGVISRARQMLDARVDQLEAMTETERLAVLRDTVLECLGTKAVVKRFGSFSPPSDLANLTGTGLPFSDAERPANEAFLRTEKVGPYALVAGTDASTSTNVLSLWLDGAPSFPSPPSVQMYLPLSQVAKIEGTRAGPFNINAGTNDELRVLVNGTPYVCILTAGAARTPAQVVADITAGLAGSGFVGEAYFFPLMYDGEVQVSGNNLTLAFGQFPPNSVNVGDEVDFYFGPDAGITRTVTAVTPSVANPQQITVDGAPLTGPTARIRYGAPTRRVRIVPSDKLASVQNKDVVQLAPLTSVQQDTGITLGMFGNLIGYSKPTDADILATFITANSKTVRAETYFRPFAEGALLRTEPSDPFTMVLYTHRGNATWDAGTVGVTVTLEDDVVGSFVGQTVCLREGMEPGEVGVVTSQTGSVLTVTFAGPVTAGSGLVELGPSGGPGIAPDMVVNVTTGPNSGKYFVDTVHPTIPFQFKCRTVAPIYRDGFNEPLFMVGDVGWEGLAFFSKTKTLASAIELYDPLKVFMTTEGPHAELGTTKYFRLPSRPTDLEDGDYIEFYESNLETPDFERVVVRQFTDTVVEMDGVVRSQGSYTFGGNTLPIAKLRTDRVISFEEYSARLKAWLKLRDAQVRAYFIDLNRFINPLLANENPTDSDVGAAENRLNELLAILTIAGATQMNADPEATLESILGSYTTPFVAEADALVKAFKEKGADRAVDFLLDCRFTTFFGLDQDEVSYAGNLQKAVRQVAMNDLPVRKTDRDARTQSPLVGSSESIDYEIETPDLDETPNIDPPVGSIG